MLNAKTTWIEPEYESYTLMQFGGGKAQTPGIEKIKSFQNIERVEYLKLCIKNYGLKKKIKTNQVIDDFSYTLM